MLFSIIMDNLTEYRDNFKMAELILVRKISLKLLCVSSKNEKTKIKKQKQKTKIITTKTLLVRQHPPWG